MSHETISRYQTRGQLGAGQIGITWEVVDNRTTGKAILKALYPRLSEDPALRDRILDDLACVSELSGTNDDVGLVGVLDHGTHRDGRIFVVTEFTAGEILASALRAGPLPAREAFTVAHRIAQTLLMLHQARLHHGAIHPNNVLLVARLAAAGPPEPRAEDSCAVKLLDAGLSAAYGAMRSAAHPSQRPFLAPEVLTSGASPAADVFALGVLLERMFSLPVAGAPAVYPRLIGPVAPLRRLLADMTQAAPAQRPTMAQVVARLGGLAAELPGFEEDRPLSIASALAVTCLSPAVRVRDGQPGLLMIAPAGSPLLAATRLPHPAHACFPVLSDAGLELPEAAGLFLAHPASGLRPLPNDHLPVPQVLRIGHEIGVALAAAHERGLYYLGLCKECVLLGQGGEVCLLPVPESQRAQDPRPPALAGSTARHHHAPEQLGGRAVSEKTDVFALGVLLNQLACGAPPGFLAPGVPPLPPDLAELIAQATAAEPTARCSLDWLVEELRFRLRITQLLEARHLGPPYQGLGRFELQGQLGPAGGCGVVLLAVDRVANTRVAIKVPHPNFPHSMVEREWDNARRVNGAEHPGIVKSQDLLMGPDGVACIVMEYVPGRTLRSILTEANGALPLRTVLRYGCQIAAAMCAVHAPHIAIVHRDLKPENLMVVPDSTVEGGQRVRILDFGIATLTAQYQGSQQVRLTRHGIVAGTPTYMAPEQRMGQAVTAAADVYALGVVLLELLGWPALQEQGPPPRPLPVVAPRPLLRLLTSMLADDPRGRPTMEQVHAQLSSLRDRPPLPIAKVALLVGCAVVPLAAYGGIRAYLGPLWVLRSEPSGVEVEWSRDGDAVPLGTTPLQVRPRRQLPGRGVVTVRARRRGFEVSEAELDPGEAATRLFVLKPLPARLVSVPANAEIFNPSTHALLGRTPYRFQAPGSATVEVRRDGFHPVLVQLAAEPGSTQSVTLAPLRRVITVVPAAAEIRDAQSDEILGQGEWRCLDGSARCRAGRVRVAAPGYQAQVVDISPQKDTVVSLTLERERSTAPPPRCVRISDACLPRGVAPEVRGVFVAAARDLSLCGGESLALYRQGSGYATGASTYQTDSVASFLDRLRGGISRNPELAEKLPTTMRLRCP